MFFTGNLAQRGRRPLVDQLDVLRRAVEVTRKRWQFRIDVCGVPPDRMHTVWILPIVDANYLDKWGAINARVSKRMFMPKAAMVGHRPTILLAKVEKCRHYLQSKRPFPLQLALPCFRLH